MSSWDTKLYCVCRSSDCSRFMIGCDGCNEWYHGDCINLAESDASYIEEYYCDACRTKNPKLKNVYKAKKEKLKKALADFIDDSSDNEKQFLEKEKKIKEEKKHKEEKKLQELERKRKEEKKQQELEKKLREEKKLLEAERKAKLEKKAMEAERKHREEKARAEEQRKKQEQEQLAYQLEQQRLYEKEKIAQQVFQASHSSQSLTELASRKSARKCGECMACHRNEDCGRCDYCKDMKKFGGPNRLRQKCRLRQCVNLGKMDEGLLSTSFSSNWDGQGYGMEDDSTSYSYDRKKSEKRPHSSVPSSQYKYDQDTSRPRKKYRTEQRSRNRYNDGDDDDDEGERQCLGPGCTEAARSGSKYCSEQCGLKLAANRLFEFLPGRISEWKQRPCEADQKNDETLADIRRQQLQARQLLDDLERRHQQLDNLLLRTRNIVPIDLEGADEEETDMSVYCVTCGHEVQHRAALRHMERCFAKCEGSTSFGSMFKSRIEGRPLFCDFYNSQSGTFCKRLKVICPEHTRDSKIDTDDVCGCPLVKNLFEETGELCRLTKRKCNKHFNWEKLWRAQIDVDRFRQFVKLDELFEQEHNVHIAKASRAGVLGLLLHQTTDHELLDVS